MPEYTWGLVQNRVGERAPLRGRGQVVFEGSVWGVTGRGRWGSRAPLTFLGDVPRASPRTEDCRPAVTRCPAADDLTTPRPSRGWRNRYSAAPPRPLCGWAGALPRRLAVGGRCEGASQRRPRRPASGPPLPSASHHVLVRRGPRRRAVGETAYGAAHRRLSPRWMVPPTARVLDVRWSG